LASTLAGGVLEVNGTFDPPTFAMTGGTLTGTGTVSAVTTNSGGVLDPGNPDADPPSVPHGDLQHNGNYTQGASGTWHVDIDGSGGISLNYRDYSHMHVNGNIILGGTLDVDMTKVATPNAEFSIGTLSASGSFADVVGVPDNWFVNIGLGGNVRGLRIVPSPTFNDVGLSHQFLADIEWLAAMEITGGFADGGYHPTAPVTRQSMAAFLYRLAGEPPFEDPDTPSFNDVPTTHQFFTEIEWLADVQITGGFADGGFHPTAAVTRQSMAAFLYRLAGEPTFTPPGTPTFDDVGLSHQFFAEIEWLVDVEITGGFADGGYHPGASVSRQSMAAFLHRFVSNDIPLLDL
jgi:hypothetical protein